MFYKDIQLVLFCATFFGGALLLPPSSLANDTFETGFADETVISHTGGSNTSIDNYSRLNSTISISDDVALSDISLCDPSLYPELTCQNFVEGTAEAEIECIGGATDGGWNADPDKVTGKCWESLDVCYGPVCKEVSGEAKIDHLTITPNSKCTTPDPDKEYCVHNDSATPRGVDGNTGDDMFKIENSASAYFEYDDLSMLNSNRLIWIARNDTVETRSMMMPSGTTGATSDYEQFIARAPANVTVESACYPVDVTLCENMDAELPKFDGLCGSSSASLDGYPDIASIPTTGFCSVGEAINVTQTETQITWQCDGYNGGSPSQQCSTPKSSYSNSDVDGGNPDADGDGIGDAGDADDGDASVGYN